jgi:3-oxoadipate enol-lactonase
VTTPTVELKHYEQGPPDAPVVMLAPSLGTTLAMWDVLAEQLAERYRVIRFDTRGHGASPGPAGPYTMSELASDVVALADSLDVDRFAFVGLSLGGAIGQTLAVEHPDRLTALVLCCTGPSFGDPQTWRDRAAQVRAEGMDFLVEPTKDRWFTPEFRDTHPQDVDLMIDMIANTLPEGYAACCDALAAYDLTERLGEISAPTRVIAGAHDPVSPPEVAQVLADRIPHADLVVLEDASHIANIAQPEEFDAAVLEHLEKHL